MYAVAGDATASSYSYGRPDEVPKKRNPIPPEYQVPPGKIDDLKAEELIAIQIDERLTLAFNILEDREEAFLNEFSPKPEPEKDTENSESDKSSGEVASEKAESDKLSSDDSGENEGGGNRKENKLSNSDTEESRDETTLNVMTGKGVSNVSTEDFHRQLKGSNEFLLVGANIKYKHDDPRLYLTFSSNQSYYPKRLTPEQEELIDSLFGVYGLIKISEIRSVGTQEYVIVNFYHEAENLDAQRRLCLRHKRLSVCD
jgi:hypothetical protein